jgi:hypothetical protein
VKTQSIDLQQLIFILDESKIIHTKRHNINTLIHTIQHPDFGIAAIMEEAIGGGTLIYEQSVRSINTLKRNGVCNPVTQVLQVTEIYKRFSRGCKSRLASRGR